MPIGQKKKNCKYENGLLGHVSFEEGVRLDLEKIESIRE
jgi:hypothetical protein